MQFGHFHPGVTLKEELEARNMTAAALALQAACPAATAA